MDKKDSVGDCQLFCQQTKDCKAFSYITNSYKGAVGEAAWGGCYLKNANYGRQEKQEGIVSGPKFCAGKGTFE